MSKLENASEKIVKLIDLLKTSGGLLIDAQIVESGPDRPSNSPKISVDLSGADSSLLNQNDAELLQAIQDVAAAAIGLNVDEYYLLWFDAGNLKADRRDEIRRLAATGISMVRKTSKPYAFAPMVSYERDLLHRALASSGLHSASVGEGLKRCVVLYPKGVAPSKTKAPPCLDKETPGPGLNAL